MNNDSTFVTSNAAWHFRCCFSNGSGCYHCMCGDCDSFVLVNSGHQGSHRHPAVWRLTRSLRTTGSWWLERCRREARLLLLWRRRRLLLLWVRQRLLLRLRVRRLTGWFSRIIFWKWHFTGLRSGSTRYCPSPLAQHDHIISCCQEEISWFTELILGLSMIRSLLLVPWHCDRNRRRL